MASVAASSRASYLVARLSAVRAILARRSVQAFVVPTSDAHESEYVADCDARRVYLSGFTGSAGTAVITADHAKLWTDGRYFAQANAELVEPWQLVKDRLATSPTVGGWLSSEEAGLPAESYVGVDPRTVTISMAKSMQAALGATGHTLKALDSNPVDEVWGEDRPNAPADPVRVHPDDLAGESVASKLDRLREKMRASKAVALVVTALDEVAWLLNMRGSDVECNPVFFGFVIVTAAPKGTTGSEASSSSSAAASASSSGEVSINPSTDGAYVFLPPGKLDIPAKSDGPPAKGPSPREHLAACGVQVHEYEQVYGAVESIARWCAAAGPSKLWIDPNVANWDVLKAAQRGFPTDGVVDTPGVVHLQAGPIPLMKAVKNDAELKGFADCHIRDGAALCRTFAKVFADVGKARGGVQSAPRVTEYDVAYEALKQRGADPSFFFPSFATIAGSGPNGAVIHYDPEEDTALEVKLGRQLLVDSGGQYADGTTDVTRTMVVPRDSEAGAAADLGAFQRRCNTRVFQGFVSIANAVFPQGTRGEQLDALARMHLWRDGLNFNHGTGHGVGAFLNVHEGPHGIAPRGRPYHGGMVAGMTVTDEPGYYQEGQTVPGDYGDAAGASAGAGASKGQVAMEGGAAAGGSGEAALCGEGFGYRVENVLSIVKADRALCPHRFGGSQVLRFGHLTWVPIQADLFDLELLSGTERRFLDTYNAECRRLLTPLLQAGADRAGTAAQGPHGVAAPADAEDDKRGLEWMMRLTRPVGGWDPSNDLERSPSLVDSPFYDGQGILGAEAAAGGAGSKRART